MQNLLIILVAILIFPKCSLISTGAKSAEPMSRTPFTYAGKLLKIPVVINETIPSYFIFDTGIGVSLISKKICQKMDCKIDRSMRGHRMSGQEIKIALTKQPSLSFATQKQHDVHLGVWDMSQGFLPDLPEFKDVEGFLSLNFFKELPLTIDYRNKEFILESPKSLQQRLLTGTVIPVEKRYEDGALVVFMKLSVPNGPPALVEVDLGSNHFILDNKYMKRLGIDPKSKKVIKQVSRDETNNPYVRHYADIKGPIFPVDGEKFQQKNLKVMFQKIIYDGLVGDNFMKRFTVTYDLKNSRLIFNDK